MFRQFVSGWLVRTTQSTQRKQVTGAEPPFPSRQIHSKHIEMVGDAWQERVWHAEYREQEQQEHRALRKIARS